MDTEIEEAAAYAARLIVDQHCSWALARTKLTEAFGKRCPMPSGADVETAVREHLSIFYPDHPALLAALRAEAAAVMRDLAEAVRRKAKLSSYISRDIIIQFIIHY